MALRRPVCAMSTHEAIAFGESGRVTIADDAGRGELYLSTFEEGREVVAPHLGSTTEGRVIRLADFVQNDNAALRCARRAMQIEAAGEGERYRDVTPIYVRLAEAEVKLRQKQDA
jgi:tRNA A37 threonylcarbamoyladenosine modification protein TsaB